MKKEHAKELVELATATIKNREHERASDSVKKITIVCKKYGAGTVTDCTNCGCPAITRRMTSQAPCLFASIFWESDEYLGDDQLTEPEAVLRLAELAGKFSIIADGIGAADGPA